MSNLQTLPPVTEIPWTSVGPRRQRTLGGSSLLVGAAAAGVLVALYAGLLGILGGAEHLAQQAVQDWPWLVVLIGGFGLQVTLVGELRHRQRLSAQTGTAAGASAGTSLVAMAACCAHHVADLLPLIGATGLAVFLTSYRTPLLVVGVVSTAIGIGLSVRRLNQHSLITTEISP